MEFFVYWCVSANAVDYINVYCIMYNTMKYSSSNLKYHEEIVKLYHKSEMNKNQ